LKGHKDFTCQGPEGTIKMGMSGELLRIRVKQGAKLHTQQCEGEDICTKTCRSYMKEMMSEAVKYR
jgi:hypothetical protein